MKINQLMLVIENAKHIINEIYKKHVNKRDYLVFSSRHGQCEITSDAQKLLLEFPEMIVDSLYKRQAIELIEIGKKLADKEKNKNLAQLNRDISPLLEHLEFRDDTFIEIRFTERKLESIYEMQRDPLVSQKHTPQTRASIRIVLGTLDELLITKSKEIS